MCVMQLSFRTGDQVGLSESASVCKLLQWLGRRQSIARADGMLDENPGLGVHSFSDRPGQLHPHRVIAGRGAVTVKGGLCMLHPS